MKNKKKSINSNLKKFSIVKLIAAIVLLAGIVFSLTRTNTIANYLKSKFAAGQVPSHVKDLHNNGDGTWKLSLDVTGDSEKKPSNVNVVVIVDRSGSMDDPAGTGAYVTSNDTDETMYGYVGGQYVLLTRQNDGSYWDPNYHYYYNGERYNGQRYEWDSTADRLPATKAAVIGLADTLLGYNGVDGNPDDTVEMALVSFAATASTASTTPTNSSSTFISAVNSLRAYGGTNWEAALKEANTVDFNDDDPTYVIFFTDGAPTRYGSGSGNGTGTGQEQEPNMSNSYNAATDDALTLATKIGADKFYTIFAYGKNYGATYLTNLTRYVGAPASNNYSASNSAELQEAFAEILAEIEMTGIADAKIVDGTTENVSTSSGSLHMLEVEPVSGFEYLISFPIDDGKVNINGKEATVTGSGSNATMSWGENKSLQGEIKDGKFVYNWKEANDLYDFAPPAASNTNSTVTWDLKQVGVLINDATYTVEFDVWPSQETYDMIADLENGADYDTYVPEEAKQYLSRDYKLKTNTGATLTYTDTRNNNGSQTSAFDFEKSVGTATDTITIIKVFEKAQDGQQDKVTSINVGIERDGEVFYPTKLTKDNNWREDNIHISTGLMRTKTTNGTTTVEVLDSGHDYKFAELDEEAYKWELETQTVHPMLINGTLSELILIDEATEDTYTVPSDMKNTPSMMYKNDGTNTFYRLESGSNKIYVVGNTNPTITATNHRRSNLNISKIVDGNSANPDDTFEITITVNDPGLTKNEKIWFSGYDGATVDFGNLEEQGWHKEKGTPWSGYYYANNNTPVTLSLKQGQNIRFTNLTDKASYTITEAQKSGYKFANTNDNFDQYITGKEGVEGTSFKPEATINSSSRTISGSITKTNSTYTVNVLNIYEKVDIEVTKNWDDQSNQDGLRNNVIVELIKNNDPTGETITIGTDSDKVTGKFTGKDRYDENGAEIVYSVKENTSITGYTMGTPTCTNNNGKFVCEVTNKHIPAVVSISGKKIWADDDNRDNLRPDKIYVQLHQKIGSNGTVTNVGDPVEVTGPNWTYSWPNLPAKSGGVEIIYSVTEILDKDSKYTADVDENNNITNNYSAETTSVKVTKVWDDDNNRDNSRTPNVTVTLTPGDFKVIPGTTPQTTVTLDEGNKWTYTWTNLFVHNTTHQANEYTVTEEQVPGYDQPKVEKVSENSFEFTVTNTKEPDKYNGTGEITVEKIWDDNNDQDGIRKKNNITSVNVKLIATTTDGAVPYDKIAAPDKTTIPENMIFTLKENESYALKITGLYANYNGKAITYTFEEVGDYTSYGYERPEVVKTEDGTKVTITNKHTPEMYENETGTITITKVWDDDDNRDGLREDVTVVLTGKTKETNKEVVLPDGVTGTYTLLTNDTDTVTVTGLYKYFEGEEIVYSIEETTVLTDYEKPDYTGSTKTAFKVTNKHTPEMYNNDTGELTLTKIWDDDSNRDGVRESVTFKVTATITNAEGEIVTVPYSELGTEESNMTDNGEFTINPVEGKDSSSFKITGLYKKYQGKDIKYTLEEISDTPEDEYTPSNPDDSVEGVISITNKHEIEKADVTITKSWIDNDNLLNTRPSSVTMHLFADGTEVTPKEGVTLTLEANKTDDFNVWSYTFEKLPKNSSNGKPIVYTVTEDAVANYTSVCPEGKLTCINTVDSLKQDIKVVKTWDDNSDQDGKRDDEEAKVTLVGTVTIEGKTEEVYRSEEPLTLGITDTWEGSFTNIPIFHNGYRITYNIEENDSELTYYSLTNKEMTENKDTHEISFALTNHHDIITKNYVVTKTWDDEGDNDGMRPESITIQLLDGNGEVVEYNGQTEFTLTTDNATEEDSNKWSFTFENLPVYSEGQEINYTVVEKVDSEKYERTDDLTTLDIINTHEPEIINFTINKVWNDDNDRDGKRPDSITIQLLGNGEAYGEPVTLTIENAIDDNTWSHTFESLPKYIDGNPVEYTISEESVAYYTAGEVTPVNNNHEDDEYTDGDTYEFDGELENTHIPELVNEDDDDPDNDGQITVTKTWDDEDNKYSSRPESITVLLYADGEEIGSTELNAENNWTYTFYEDYDGNPLYKYRDKGIVIVYSIGEIEVANYETIINGFEITNKYNGPIPEITPPNTGIIYNNNDNSIFELFMLFITLISTVLLRKKLED